MDQRAIVESITTTFAGVDADVASMESGAPEIAWGDTFFIYDPDRALEGAKRFPFATIVTKNYADFDNLSNLDREDVFRLNIGLSGETYESLIDASAVHDFAALNRLMPHPVYAEYHWVCVLNPSEETFEALQPLVREAYDRAVERYTRGGHGAGDPRTSS